MGEVAKAAVVQAEVGWNPFWAAVMAEEKEVEEKEAEEKAAGEREADSREALTAELPEGNNYCLASHSVFSPAISS